MAIRNSLHIGTRKILLLGGLERDEAAKRVERVGRDVLANPVIEQFRFKIVE